MPGTEWGVFTQAGSPVLVGDSVDTFSFQRDASISTAPQEQGAFASYNKVAEPYTPRLTYAVNGNRSDFLSALDAAIQSLDLYVVTSPDANYPNANLVHYDYQRTIQQGVTLLLVNVWLEEVRQGTGPNLQNTASINGTRTQQLGQNQPVNTGPGGSPILVSGLEAPSSGSVTTLSTPQIGPLNYDATNLPQVPNTWNGLSSAQQDGIISTGNSLGASSARVYPPGPETPDVEVEFIGAGPPS